MKYFLSIEMKIKQRTRHSLHEYRVQLQFQDGTKAHT